MVERLGVYKCDGCDYKVAVMRGGSGDLTCCGEPMRRHHEDPDEARERKAAMPQPPVVLACAQCGVAVVVFHEGGGAVHCCDEAMAPYVEDHIEFQAEHPEAPKVPTMEHNLDLPVKTVIDFMQRRQPATTYFGVNTQKCPLDLWVYQEMIFELRPEVIVEIGNAYGGSALVMAHLLDHMDHGRIIGVDIQHHVVPAIVRDHPRITLITGDGCASFGQVKALIGEGETVLAIEDSSHTYENTLNVLRTYQGLVTLGSYFIVEDSNCHHGVDIGPYPGPYEAIETFIDETTAFEVDRSKESFFITWNPMGFLRKVR